MSGLSGCRSCHRCGGRLRSPIRLITLTAARAGRLSAVAFWRNFRCGLNWHQRWQWRQGWLRRAILAECARFAIATSIAVAVEVIALWPVVLAVVILPVVILPILILSIVIWAIVLPVAAIIAVKILPVMTVVLTVILAIKPVISVETVLAPVRPVLIVIAVIVAVVVVIVLPVVAIVVALRRLIERTWRLLRLWLHTAVGLLHAWLQIRAKIIAAIVLVVFTGVEAVLARHLAARHATGEWIAATLADLLLAEAHDDAIVVLGVLHIVFSQHRIARRVRITRQRHVFLGDMRRRATEFDVRTGALKAACQRILRLAVTISIAPAAAPVVLLTLPHGLPFYVSFKFRLVTHANWMIVQSLDRSRSRALEF